MFIQTLSCNHDYISPIKYAYADDDDDGDGLPDDADDDDDGDGVPDHLESESIERNIWRQTIIGGFVQSSHSDSGHFENRTMIFHCPTSTRASDSAQRSAPAKRAVQNKE